MSKCPTAGGNLVRLNSWVLYKDVQFCERAGILEDLGCILGPVNTLDK